MTKISRDFLLAFSALVLAVGAFMHASAFHKIVRALDESNLVAFAASALKVLWLMDSTVTFVLAAVFAFAVFVHRPSADGSLFFSPLFPELRPLYSIIS